MPDQRTAPEAAAVTAHERIRVVPRYTRALPVIRSDADQPRRVVSAVPSPFGENDIGPAVAARVAGVRSTRTVHDRAPRLPALSTAVRVRRYSPSATTTFALVRPFQATAALPPAPVRVATAAPSVEPDSRAALKVQPLAPLAVSLTVTVSRMPSPFGEIRVLLDDADPTTGATVSIVTPYVARTPARKAGVGS